MALQAPQTASLLSANELLSIECCSALKTADLSLIRDAVHSLIVKSLTVESRLLALGSAGNRSVNSANYVQITGLCDHLAHQSLRPKNLQFFHFRAQRARRQSQLRRGAQLTGDFPTRLFQRADNMIPLDAV